MKRDINIFNPNSIQSSIDLLNSKKFELTKENWRAIGELAARTAEAKFASAIVDRPTKVYCTYELIENGVKIIALGYDTLFIEYGTGVIYPDSHPDKDSSVSPRGTYGQHKGSNPYGWTYKTLNGDYVHTLGMPANQCMYDTVQELKRDLPSLIAEFMEGK